MGQQQGNTYVENCSGESVRVVLTDTNNQTTDQFLANGQKVYFSTPAGENTISLYKQSSDGKSFEQTSCSDYSTCSHGHFFTRKTEGYLEVLGCTGNSCSCHDCYLTSQYTHIKNKTNQTVRVILIDVNNRRSDKILPPDNCVQFRGPQGRTVVSLLKELTNKTGFAERACTTYTSYTQCNYDIEQFGSHLQFVKSK